MTIGLVMMSGFRDNSFAVLWVVVGVGTPIYFIFKYLSYQGARHEYELRREAAIRRSNERTNQLATSTSTGIAPPSTRDGNSREMATLEPKLDTPLVNSATTIDEGGTLRDSPGEAVDDRISIKTEVIVSVAVLAVFALILFGVLTRHFNGHRKRAQARPTEPASRLSVIPISVIPTGDQTNASALVNYFASGTPEERDEAARLLEKQPELAQETIPLLCHLFDGGPIAPGSATSRKKILAILSAYGSRASEAAPVLARRFCAIASAIEREFEPEARQIARTMSAFGPDQKVIAELPTMLAAAKSELLHFEVARLIAVVDAQVAISDEQLAKQVCAILEKLLRERLLEEDTAFVLNWAVGRITKLSLGSGALHNSVVKLQKNLQDTILAWENAIEHLEESTPPKKLRHFSGHRHRRTTVYRTNPRWLAHQNDLEAARDRVKRLSNVDQAIRIVLNKWEAQSSREVVEQ
jgi:hypothetical protein